MVHLICPKCKGEELVFTESPQDESTKDYIASKTLIADTLKGGLKKTSSETEEWDAYCKHCDLHLENHELKEKNTQPDWKVKLAGALIMIAVLMFLSGLLLLVFSLLLGVIVLAGAALPLVLSSYVYKSLNQ